MRSLSSIRHRRPVCAPRSAIKPGDSRGERGQITCRINFLQVSGSCLSGLPLLFPRCAAQSPLAICSSLGPTPYPVTWNRIRCRCRSAPAVCVFETLTLGFLQSTVGTVVAMVLQVVSDIQSTGANWRYLTLLDESEGQWNYR